MAEAPKLLRATNLHLSDAYATERFVDDRRNILSTMGVRQRIGQSLRKETGALSQNRSRLAGATLLLVLLTLQACGSAGSASSKNSSSSPSVTLDNSYFLQSIDAWFTNNYPTSKMDTVTYDINGYVIGQGPYDGEEQGFDNNPGTINARVRLISMTPYTDGSQKGYILAGGFQDGEGNVTGNKGVALLALPANSVILIGTAYVPYVPNIPLTGTNGAVERESGQGYGSTYFNVANIPVSELWQAYSTSGGEAKPFAEVPGYYDPSLLNKPGSLNFINGTTLQLELPYTSPIENVVYDVSQPPATVDSVLAQQSSFVPVFSAKIADQIPQNLTKVIKVDNGLNNGFEAALNFPGAVDTNFSDLQKLLNFERGKGWPDTLYGTTFQINGVTVPSVPLTYKP